MLVEDIKIAILINEGSASASEIIAGAVQDLDRGVIIGTRSFGKGLVQRQLPLDSGAALRVTIARYYTPSGRLIQRPYEDGNDLAYYRELYAKDRESKIDSLKELRPKYKTKSGRTVYGGGGITPDIYIPYKNSINSETGKIVRNPKRPIFNFASKYASKKKNDFISFKSFKKDWIVSDSLVTVFFSQLDNDSITVITDSVLIDIEYIKNTIKSEIAGSVWGKDEAANIRLLFDNQVVEALKHFNEADAFLD
jgi:carboxyl-terminal processing protease